MGDGNGFCVFDFLYAFAHMILVLIFDSAFGNVFCFMSKEHVCFTA